MDEASASAALAAREATPISQLCPDLPNQQSRVVRGEVTICWPLNSVRQSFAFVIAEPDVRLRASHGQIRVQIDGPNAKPVAQSGIFSGDEVLLALDGAEWTDNTYQDTRIPGSSSQWELRYPGSILFEFTSDSGEKKTLALDGQPVDSVAASSAAADFEVPVIDISAPDAPAISSPLRVAEPDEYASPAFIKRARLSYGSLLEGDDDLFEEDGWAKGKGRKKARFGRYSNSWRYTSRSPSPESGGEDVEMSAPAVTASGTPPAAQSLPSPEKPAMTDEGCQVVEADLTPEKARDVDRTRASPPREQPPSPSKAQSAGPPENLAEIDDGQVENGQAHLSQEDDPGQQSASSDSDEPAQMPVAFSAARGFVAPSLGDYSSPRFAVNIPGSSSAYEGPSLEEQVRFGFHHSPASDHQVAGPEATHPVLFSQAPAVPNLVESTHPQTIPLWNLGSSQVMDPDHVDAELNIDPALMAAETPGMSTDGEPVQLSRSEPAGALDYDYNQRRSQNEAEERMVGEVEGSAVRSSSESYSNDEEAEYERELKNQAGDDYDMRAYADVDDDVEDDDIDQEYGVDEGGEIFEGGGSYYSDEDEDLDGSDQDDEEQLDDEDEGNESEADMSAPTMRRAPAQPIQQTGPIVIDLLSDSSDDDDGDTEVPAPAVSTTTRMPRQTIQNSPPSPSYEVQPDDSENGDSEGCDGYEDSEDYEGIEGSDVDASGESEEEFDGLESPAPTKDQQTLLADAARGDDASDAGNDDDDGMQEETGDTVDTSMEAPSSPAVAAQEEDSSVNAKENAVCSPVVRTTDNGEGKEEAEHIDDVDLLVDPPSLTKSGEPQGSEEQEPAGNVVSSSAAEDPNSQKAIEETMRQLPTPLDTQTEILVEAQASRTVQVDTYTSSQDDMEQGRDTHTASSPAPALTTTTIAISEQVEMVEVVGDDSSDDDSQPEASVDGQYEDEEMTEAQALEQEPEDDEMADVRSDDSGLESDEHEVTMENTTAIDSTAAFATQEAPSTMDEPLSPSDASGDDSYDEEGQPGAKETLETPTKAGSSVGSGAGPSASPRPRTASSSGLPECTLNASASEEAPRDSVSPQVPAEETKARESVDREADNDTSSDVEPSAPASPAQKSLLASSPMVECARGQDTTHSHGSGVFATQAPCSADEFVNDDILTQPQDSEQSTFVSNVPDAAADDLASAQQQRSSRFASQEPLSDDDQAMEDVQSDKEASAPEEADESNEEDATEAADNQSGSVDPTPSSPSHDLKTNSSDEYCGNNALPSPAQEDPQGSNEPKGPEMEMTAPCSPDAGHETVSDAITVRDEPTLRKSPRGIKARSAMSAMSDPSIKLAHAAAGAKRALPRPGPQAHPGPPARPSTPAAKLADGGASGGSHASGTEPSRDTTPQGYVSKVANKSGGPKPEQAMKLRNLDLITSLLGPDWGGPGGTPPPSISLRATSEVRKMAEAAKSSLPLALFDYFRARLWTAPPENSLDELQGFFFCKFPDGTFPERKAVQATKELRRIVSSRSNTKARSETLQQAHDPSLKLAKAALKSPSRSARGSSGGDGDGEAVPETPGTITSLKLEIGRFFRSEMSDYTSLVSLRLHPGKQVNVVAVVTAAGKQPVRTKARQYAMSISITDHTVAPTGVVEVQFYRAHKEALPLTKPGDRVLLRNFTVVGLTGRGQGLRSNESSEYAVFDDEGDGSEEGDDGAKDEGGSSSGTHRMAQLRGGPVELADHEHEVTDLLRKWYGMLAPAAKEKLYRANKKLAAGGAALSTES